MGPSHFYIRGAEFRDQRQKGRNYKKMSQQSLFTDAEITPDKVGLTVLSFGGGQDSTAILYKIIHDPVYRAKYAPGRLLVVMSDTGSEHMRTYMHIAKIKVLCKKHGIEFYFITGDMGYHRNGWEYGLKAQYRSKNVIGMMGGWQLCTDHLKIRVVDRFVSAWIAKNYDVRTSSRIDTAVYSFVKQYGRINLIIGFAADEGRDKKSGKRDPIWKQRCVDRVYPLIEDGWDRKKCQEVILSLGYEVPPPSNCTICFYMSKQEIVWLHRFMPDELDEWVWLEANKIEHNLDKGKKNNGASGSLKLLPERITEALELYGDWSDERLDE